MKIFKDKQTLQKEIFKNKGLSFIPTMGGLHKGHISLIKRAKKFSNKAVVSIFVILFVIIQRHYFEYQYAWQHSSTALPLKYMVSCFWEGQEGSFLLWMVWHVVIGNILMFTARSWESPVMAIISIAQIMLSTMLLGIEFLGSKIGSSPFNLLRDVTQGPIFVRPDYLTFIKDEHY